MRILLPSSGGREVALAQQFVKNGHDVYTDSKANPGLIEVGARVLTDLDRDKPESILYAAEDYGMDLTVIGGESMLERGVVNLFEERRIPIVGPTANAARLETDKWDCCQVLTRARVRIPHTVHCMNIREVEAELAGRDEAVIKPLRGTLGKGVFVMESPDFRGDAIKHVGQYPGRYLVQERIRGRELSFFVAVNRMQAVFLGSAADYKLLGHSMTGGMGGYSPHELLTPALYGQTMDRTVHPVLSQMDREGRPFRGIAYFQLMITAEGEIYVIEINVRFGDPEAQLLMPLYRGDLAHLLATTCKGQSLDEVGFKVRSDLCTVGYVLAADGYPGSKVRKDDVIQGLPEAAQIADVIQAGTKRVGDEIRTDGGRVLTVVGQGSSYDEAMAQACKARDLISFTGQRYRSDIARHLSAKQRTA